MIKEISLLGLLIFAAAADPLVAQDKSNLPDCRTYRVQDSDKRDFNDRDVFTLDVDGDGVTGYRDDPPLCRANETVSRRQNQAAAAAAKRTGSPLI